ncbi:MAG: hypothetical protein O7F76_08350, partial [Planctomycetota bacterium]|nr:hypothetical protein [Planctomycetota bacterium]
KFGMDSPYMHVLSKGVFVGLKREARHRVPLIFDTRDGRDSMSFIPWGPVSLWGPTETVVERLEEGMAVEPEDVRSLLGELNRHLAKPATPDDVVSLRLGVRPLVVRRPFNGNRGSLDLSRRYRIHRDACLPWISLYGGKLTGCVSLASEVVGMLSRTQSTNRGARHANNRPAKAPPMVRHPELSEPVPEARWCADREMCWTLEDYLRRRTNISQWIARCGLGKRDEHAAHLTRLARSFCGEDEAMARGAVEAYRRKIVDGFDRVLADC